MAGSCIYCGAPALVTGPSGVCVECRRSLPAKKHKPARGAGHGVDAPTLVMGTVISSGEIPTALATMEGPAGPVDDPLAVYEGAPAEAPAAEAPVLTETLPPATAGIPAVSPEELTPAPAAPTPTVEDTLPPPPEATEEDPMADFQAPGGEVPEDPMAGYDAMATEETPAAPMEDLSAAPGDTTPDSNLPEDFSFSSPDSEMVSARETSLSGYLTSPTHDPMESYRALWEELQANAQAQAEPAPEVTGTPTPEQPLGINVSTYTPPPETTPVPPPVSDSDDPMASYANIDLEETASPTVPEVANIPPPQTASAQEDILPAPLPTPSPEPAPQAPPLPETPAAVATALPTHEDITEETPPATAPAPDQSIRWRYDLLSLGLGIAVGGSVAGWGPTGGMGALAGGLLGASVAGLCSRGKAGLEGFQSAFFASITALIVALTKGQGATLVPSFLTPVAGALPPGLGVLAVFIVLFPLLGVLLSMVLSKVMQPSLLARLPLPKLLTPIGFLVFLGVGGLPLALSLKGITQVSATPESKTSACIGQLGLLTLMQGVRPSPDLAALNLPPVTTNISATPIADQLPDRPDELVEATFHTTGGLPVKMLCLYACEGSVCQPTGLTPLDATVEKALAASTASAVVQSLDYTGPGAELFSQPPLTETGAPPLSRCRPHLEVLLQTPGLEGLSCVGLVQQANLREVLLKSMRPECPSLTLAPTATGGCTIHAQVTGMNGNTCQITATLGENAVVSHCQ